MAKSGGWRSYAYNCIFVVYTKKKSGKIFFIREKSGNYQGISFLDFSGHPASVKRLMWWGFFNPIVKSISLRKNALPEPPPHMQKHFFLVFILVTAPLSF